MHLGLKEMRIFFLPFDHQTFFIKIARDCIIWLHFYKQIVEISAWFDFATKSLVVNLNLTIKRQRSDFLESHLDQTLLFQVSINFPFFVASPKSSSSDWSTSPYYLYSLPFGSYNKKKGGHTVKEYPINARCCFRCRPLPASCPRIVERRWGRGGWGHACCSGLRNTDTRGDGWLRPQSSRLPELGQGDEGPRRSHGTPLCTTTTVLSEKQWPIVLTNTPASVAHSIDQYTSINAMARSIDQYASINGP